MLLAAEALRDVPAASAVVTTPLGPADARIVRTDVVVVPVLRAGLGMLDAVLELLPSARVGHIGLQRDETTAVASQYYSKFPPEIAASFVLMIAMADYVAVGLYGRQQLRRIQHEQRDLLERDLAMIRQQKLNDRERRLE